MANDQPTCRRRQIRIFAVNKLAGYRASECLTSRRRPVASSQKGNTETDAACDGLEPDKVPMNMEKMDAQRQLSQYRERLVRQMERSKAPDGGVGQPLVVSPNPHCVSPIEEETGCAMPQQYAESPRTMLTESTATIRGIVVTPGPLAGTPSFPFPRMTSGSVASSVHRPFTTLSPTVAPPASQSRIDSPQVLDSFLSNTSTPPSILTFLPPGYSSHPSLGQNMFPSPNLYELTLMLSAEPGLDAWWSTVVQILTEFYHAERVTLSTPADSTDIENVPWGQKATFNAHVEDELSLAYMARGSSLVRSTIDDASEIAVFRNEESWRHTALGSRPGLFSRHSFTSFEDRKERSSRQRMVSTFRRPEGPVRSKSSYPALASKAMEVKEHDLGSQVLNQRTLEEHDALEEQQPIPSWELLRNRQPEGQGKVLKVLQALDYEADPLVDHNGILRVIERGKVIALTRSYPYLEKKGVGAENKPPEQRVAASFSTVAESVKKKVRKKRSNSTSKLSALLAGVQLPKSTGRSMKGVLLERKTSCLTSRIDDDEHQPSSPNFEEFEQAPPSPWSQSPAASPAVRADPSENPFFADYTVDENSFNPSPGSRDYSILQPAEAIGLDNSWTVLHIPLTHVLLSKPNPAFKLDSAVMDQKSSSRGNLGARKADRLAAARGAADSDVNQRHAPIAILSILTPLIPYPSNLRHSLEHLAPHLATSFSMCRHYTNLEVEVNALHKRRHHNYMGFAATAPESQSVREACTSPAYAGGVDTMSMTSLAGSVTSPSDYSLPSRSGAGSLGGTPSWDPQTIELVTDKRTSASASSPAPVGDESYSNTKLRSGEGLARTCPTTSVTERRSSLRLSGGKVQWQDQEQGLLSPAEYLGSTESVPRVSDEPRQVRASQAKELHLSAPSRNRETTSGQAHRYTQLHSHGADFASTLQSLSPSSVIGKGVALPQGLSRKNSASQAEMTPPSDKLKGLILDSLPAHVFVALPQTGEIVWVNSIFLTFRGLTSSDLAVDPWGSIHAEDRDAYLRSWRHSIRTGEQFSTSVRIRRFDGQYRWFYARAVASKDKRGVIMQFLGSFMDIHEQHVAELKAARQQEIEASEAKHRLLANLIPQIIFTATEGEGVTFANEQWLSYTGQTFDDSLGLGFMSFVHPDDLAKCRIPVDWSPAPVHPTENNAGFSLQDAASLSSAVANDKKVRTKTARASTDSSKFRDVRQALSRNNGSSSDSMYEPAMAALSELARQGVIKAGQDSSGRLSYTTEIRLRAKSGEYRWHLIRCVEIESANSAGRESSYFGSATDINDLKLLQTKLKGAMESKGRFLSNMSHEIRTPLIGISGMVSFLQDTTLNEEQRDYTNTIQTSANSLLMIINDILDLSKVDAGMMKLSYEWFHTRSLIEDVNELVSTMAIAKRLELNYVVEEDVPAWIKGDRVRIRQVLLNVIGNAIKFTSQGEVFSRCKVLKLSSDAVRDNEIMLDFSVIDTGRGFTKEEACLIFKPFSQIDGSSTRQHGGSGLGLVISRQLVELHGGKMDGTAVPGEGSTFTFSARFNLPTDEDHPESPASPRQSASSVNNIAPQFKNPLLNQAVTSPSASPSLADVELSLPPTVPSSGSSVPSVRSERTEGTTRSSMSSVSNSVGLAQFSEAARASGQDLSQMKLEMPPDRSLPSTNPTLDAELVKNFRPPMYSILIICPQTHSREATTLHIKMTLPREIPHQITALASADEARRLIGGEEPAIFTHIVVNLPSSDEIIGLIDKIMRSAMIGKARVLILSDSVQRQAILKQVAHTKYDHVLSEKNVTFIYKPVKPSRFAVIFDPGKERDLSIDRNRSTAQRLVESQRQKYKEMEKRMGNRGYKVLLVEDNPVNQKVLQRYLRKVGLDVNVVADGVECTTEVLSRPHGYYSLILCDLHMPRKDGYQACREIREWEREGGHAPMPVIALSANVMSDVQEKCVAAGFSDYVTKPVDFIDLSNALSKSF